MIELCQILKKQFQPVGLGGGGASSFIYGSGGMGNSMNGRQIYEQLNQVNFIGLLAETFNIFVPSAESFEAGDDKEKVFKAFKPEAESPDSQEDLDKFIEEVHRLDVMKINSMEIIISFQQSEHVPLSSISKFLTGMDQSSKGYPFLVYLVKHLIYSGDQGIKIQICDFFKSIFEIDNS
jgi:hypothetical protein